MNKFFYVYILFSLKDNKLYIGYTEDLKARVTQHEKGFVAATRSRRPVELIHYESFSDKKDAKIREKFLKSGFGRSQLKQAFRNKLRELDYKYL